MMQATFVANLNHLDAMLDWLRTAIDHLHVKEGLSSSIELACEEALVNIIQYSYPEKAGNVSITCKREAQRLVVTLIDQGVPYNPLLSLKPPALSPRIGGYGICIMLHLMDQVDYHYINGSNTLVLIKENV